MRRTGRDGFALLAVLWVLLIASALAAELHAGIRADQRMAANARAAARARWAARAGLAQSIEALRSRLAVTAPTGMGLMSTDTLLIPVQRLDMDGVQVTAAVTDARARLNLNLATEEELRALFLALGWEPGRAASRAAAAARWRSARLPPFQAADTATVRLRPPPGAFAAVEELRGVAGFTEAEFAQAAAQLTVASDGRINLNTASAAVLRTLPGIDEPGAARIVARRTRRPLSTEYEVVDVLPGGTESRDAPRVLAGLAARAALVPREAEMRVSAAVPGSAVGARIRAVAVMAGGTRLPVVQVVER